MTDPACPCGSKRPYTTCCHPLHCGQVSAETAVQLMRSRYSAYVLKLAPYLVETTHPEKRSPDLGKNILDWATQVEFCRLEIIQTQQGEFGDKIGKVEFVAHYRHQGEAFKLHELSRFRRYQKNWVYVDGVIYP